MPQMASKDCMDIHVCKSLLKHPSRTQVGEIINSLLLLGSLRWREQRQARNGAEKGHQIRVQQLYHPDGERNRNVAETRMAKPRTKTCRHPPCVPVQKHQWPCGS